MNAIRHGKVGFVCLLTIALSWLLISPVQARGWAKKLGLSPTQMQQIRNIRFQTKRQHIQLKARIQLARLELRQLLNQQKPDATLVSQAIDKAGKLHLQLKKQRILARLKMQAVLTTKQFEVWKQIRARRHARRRRWKKMRRMRRMRRMRNMQ